MQQAARTIALIGGGRWARVHASNLSTLLSPVDRVLWVSRHNRSRQHDLVERLPKDTPRFDLMDDIEGLQGESASAAVIVTAAGDHASMVHACLERGMHVFVEKPLAFRAADATSLIAIAAKADLVLGLGVHLLSASYLEQFKTQLAGRAVARMSICWFDRAHEVRHGENKGVDGKTPLVHDVYPHIWSLVKIFTSCAEPEIITVSKKADGSIAFELSAGAIAVDVQCGRHAPSRQRRIIFSLRDGGTAAIDFTEEPGIATLDGDALPSDPLWTKSPRPVMAEVGRFLDQVSSAARDPSWPHMATNCLGSVSGAEALFARLESS